MDDSFQNVDATNADVRDGVQDRYGAGAQAVEAALCLSLIHISEPTRPY